VLNSDALDIHIIDKEWTLIVGASD
jgi:hypothetical protein